jgi:hypothetical protein
VQRMFSGRANVRLPECQSQQELTVEAKGRIRERERERKSRMGRGQERVIYGSKTRGTIPGEPRPTSDETSRVTLSKGSWKG